MAQQKDYIYIYSVEGKDGFRTYFKDKEQAQAVGAVTVEGYDKDKCAEFMVERLNLRENRRRASSLSSKAVYERLSPEQRAEWHRKGGVGRAKQRYGA